ncbi:hypothetical protein SAMN05421856_10572 [Chryseobacterium taichungense]|uniref:Uncharacterized protein n=1 Tax=Chryseobacterium taichungense TaxID=295069 RepID=A0A1H8A2U0_9FLAO|nr:hypothetical protein [Chryseobacterium taichungense]SEM65030.1 hypothetical protein SAMN05421856_10572 [Chryseobacterium taichungense]
MKKKKIDFEAEFWDSHQKHSCMTLIDAFFQMDDLPAVKEILCDVMNYSTQPKVLLKNNPYLVFHFYLCIRSFIRAGYLIQFKSKKWKVNDPPEYKSRLLQGLLSDKEYRNPFLVFQKAFKEFSLKEFEYFITEFIYFSLANSYDIPTDTNVAHFIHLTKMLDAAQIIRERGIEKIKKQNIKNKKIENEK